MADGNVSQGLVRALSDEETLAESSKISVRTIFSYPAETSEASQASVRTLSEVPTISNVALLVVRALIKGRVDEPTIRAWTFTLDGHDFYVLRLGSNETLVYDTYSQQWSVYGSGDGDPWRAYTGRNWQGGRALGLNWSDVICGDDGTGTLYFLSPDDDFDDDVFVGSETPRPFLRQITGQLTIKPGYASVPCFGVQLFGSVGSVESSLPVSLSVSDDRGFTYTNMGSVSTTPSNYTARVNWLSLGSMVAPGRLFKVEDEGALKRIDSLETPE